MPGDTEVFKPCSEKCHSGNISHQRMIGGDLANNAVGRYDIQHIQAFNHRRAQRIPAVVRLGVRVAAYLGVGRAERDNPAEPVVLYMLGEVSAALVEFHITWEV